MNSTYSATAGDLDLNQTITNVAIGVRPGGFLMRLVATILDLLIVTVFNLIISVGGIIVIRLVFLSAGAEAQSMSAMMVGLYYLLSLIIVPLFYFGYFLNKFAATPGKMMMGLKVVNSESGENLGVIRAYFREVWVKGIMFAPLGVPYLLILARKDRRGLHDFIVNSCVVKQD